MSRGAVAAQRHSGMPEPPTRTSGSTPDKPSGRRRALPKAGMPVARENRRGWAILSALVHLLIIMLLVAPAALHTGVVIEQEQGAGGAGPAGGGGGGMR